MRVGVGGRLWRLKQMSGWKETVDAWRKNRHHTLKACLFVCMGHACMLGQEPSLVGDGFSESVCFLI